MKFQLRESIEFLHPELKRLELSLAGFETESTSVVVHSPNIVSFSPVLGFRTLKLEKNLTYAGQGPISFRILITEKKPESGHFFLFNGEELKDTENFYFLIPATLGFQIPYERFSILIVSDEEWYATEPQWSAGLYKGAGLIKIPQRSVEDSRFESVILHEATHGFNEFMMEWDKTNASWSYRRSAEHVAI